MGVIEDITAVGAGVVFVIFAILGFTASGAAGGCFWGMLAGVAGLISFALLYARKYGSVGYPGATKVLDAEIVEELEEGKE